MNKEPYKLIIIGGGAAGYFLAANVGELIGERTLILEKTSKTLSKVKVSGGGRCNVTHNCFDVKKLSSFYPRGEKFVRKMFQHFQPKDTMEWFESRGIELKVEKDNRVFPKSDNSQSIIDALKNEAHQNRVEPKLGESLSRLEKMDFGNWLVHTSDSVYESENVFIAPGASVAIYELLKELGLKVISPVPSLFTFKIEDPRIEGLQGIAFSDVEVKLAGTKIKETGPLLITHWGLSAPAILKTSARAARELFQKNYQASVLINFLPEKNFDSAREELLEFKANNPKKRIGGACPFEIPKRYWLRSCELLEVSEKPWSEVSKKSLNKLAENLTAANFQMNGKTTFKEEFVTAGGVDLSEINSTTMEASRYSGLYFGGEVLNIDALTGGFNFQAAWTGAWIASRAIKEGA